MQAEKLILETDAQGRLKQQPRLPPNAQFEAIFLVLRQNTPAARRKPKTGQAEAIERVFGSYAGSLSSSEDFARRKQEEQAQEEAKWQRR